MPIAMQNRAACAYSTSAKGQTDALIFDMDGTMIDSMGHHGQSWAVFSQRHGLAIDLPDLMRRTTGRTGAECMRELFQRPMPDDEAWTLIAEKEAIYRDMFGPVFAEVAGFKPFCAAAQAMGLKVGVGTAGDRHNIAFAMQHLQLPGAPLPVVGGDEGLAGKPEPAIFLEVAKRLNTPANNCIVFEDAPFGIEAARRAGMRAVAMCTSHPAHQLAGPHVLTAAANYLDLLESKFLETLNVATA
ncbi:MAG: HAD family hydrolase [Comamonadaceae bacterium]|nr:MAG: HAD family hydrolase [Comamonadaceae bacterium]